MGVSGGLKCGHYEEVRGAYLRSNSVVRRAWGPGFEDDGEKYGNCGLMGILVRIGHSRSV